MNAIVLVSLFFAQADVEKEPPLLNPQIEEKFTSMVKKAEIEFNKVRARAAETRLKAYKDLLSRTMKTGEAAKAVALKKRIDELEKDSDIGTKAPKSGIPKDAFQLLGHSYLLIREPATWHVAKRRCEQMGGHLAVLNSDEETEAIREFFSKEEVNAWIGATDEETEGQWKWIDGSDCKLSNDHISNRDNGGENWMMWAAKLGDYNDSGNVRFFYLCEWEFAGGE